ncbi:DEAD-domain-containing protein, partial [Piedraia hortae CBS 480.64]
MPKFKSKKSQNKRKRNHVSAEELQVTVSQLDPTVAVEKFSELPLSEPTQEGLKAAHYETMTDIQAKAIPLALKRKDVTGAARTGSGKTLAFVIPVLENLYRAQHIGPDAGLGALIISPTRELAIQIFQVLVKVGKAGHQFAAGLIIGGTSLEKEKAALYGLNIVVCTPGRILQHLSQTVGLNVDALNMLVLDEADRIMDMGFQRDVDAILEYLPRERQTLLFSATQTQQLSDLQRLALRDPEYISVHESASTATPETLEQHYVLTPLPEKLNTLWSFLKSSTKSKILVFFSSGKQVRFAYETFRRMQPGIPLLHILGRKSDKQRLETIQKFTQAKHSCLFATDVMERGIDFPNIDWVVQVDSPPDAKTHIHRVGRTARDGRRGRAVLFLDPSEENGMLKRLEAARVPIARINIRHKKQQNITAEMQNMCHKEPELNYLGQKAFVSHVRSLHLQKDSEVFALERYDLKGFAESLGIHGMPRVKFLKADGEAVKLRKNASRAELFLDDNDDDDEVRKKKTERTRHERLFERKNQDVLTEHHAKLMRDDDDEEEEEEDSGDGDLLNAKQRIAPEDIKPVEAEGKGAKFVHIEGIPEPLRIDSKRGEKRLHSKKAIAKLKSKGVKHVFDDEGNMHPIYELEDEEAFKAKGVPQDQRRQFVQEEVEKVQAADIDDKALAREKKRLKKEKRKAREREARMEGKVVDEDAGDARAAFLADTAAVEESDVDEQPAKAQRREPREIETFDDLEAEAAKLL